MEQRQRGSDKGFSGFPAFRGKQQKKENTKKTREHAKIKQGKTIGKQENKEREKEEDAEKTLKKRVAVYLRGHPDYMQWYPVQEEKFTVVLSTDADWATCRETRRSNSGGTLQVGDHLIAAWSRVQPRIALSSGEAELSACMRGISQTLGFVHMMREFMTDDWGRIVHRVDPSACRAIMLRRGCGGPKHITVKSSWVQDAVREYSIEIERISREEMLAHVLASSSSAEEKRNHLTKLNAYKDGETESWSLAVDDGGGWFPGGNDVSIVCLGQWYVQASIG